MSRPIDKEFEEADDTGVLDISGRKLRQFPNIPSEILDVTYVFEADLSANRFDRVPKEVLGFKALVKLSCHNNSIRWLMEELYLLKNLKEIDLSRNFLSRVPEELCQLNLYSLNLSNNRLQSFPENIGELKNLQFLDLSCNALSDLPGSFTTLECLRHLNLHRNQLRDLPVNIDELWQLEYLDVSSNQLSRLPFSLRRISSLQEFMADDNPLEFPPSQVCVRGLVHITKYLEVSEKRGDGYILNQRDESLRRKKERSQKKNSTYRPLSESTPVRNGDEKKMGLLDEMANLVSQAFGEKDGEKTPTGVSGSVHWSVAQFMNAPNQSQEEYREATHKLYMAQEGSRSKNPSGPCPSSPAGSSSLGEASTTPTSLTPSLPTRRSDENVYRSSTVGSASDVRPANFVGRSLSNERFPRSGSWNSHMRISSPVLPSKYMADKQNFSEPRKTSTGTPPGTGLSSKSATELSSADSAPTTPPKKSKRPPPLDTKKPNGERGDSDHEGSLTPTNEEPPTLEEPTTPKDDDETFSDLPNPANGSAPSNGGSSTEESIPVVKRRPSKPLPTPPPKSPNRQSTSSNTQEYSDIEIRDLDSSPTSALKRLPSVSEDERGTAAAAAASTDKMAVPDDGKWQRLASPRRKKEKDVFKFLKENDANYTIRRQKMQINIMLEKNQHVKKTVESLVGVELSDDIGEWVTDGVVLCKVINILHPGTISNIHTPPPGQSLSRIKQTINISAFIDACKALQVPEEQLCSAGDIVELRDPVRVISCLQRVLETKPGNLI